MTLPAIVSSILGICTVTFSLLSQVYFWQRKEYRLDRMRSFITSRDMVAMLLPWLGIAIILTDLAWIIFLYGHSNLADIVGWIALLGFGIHHGHRIIKRGLYRPVFTLKAISILLSLIVVTAIYLWVTFTVLVLVPLQWATLLLLLPVIVAVIVQVVNIPFYLKKKQILWQATRHRVHLKTLQVIGITGSYGKTSTKHFLEHILTSSGKKVIVTAEHRNAELPVAQDFLKRVTPETEFYIAEMGAYRTGEIALLSQILKPSIGVITAIGNQHLDLFGSKPAILKAKWELINALPTNGIAVLNGDDELLSGQGKNLKKSTRWFSLNHTADVWVKDTEYAPQETITTLMIGPAEQRVTIPLASEALLGSVLAAVATAYAAGISAQSIFSSLASLKPYPRTMEIKTGKNNSIIIDDSYSANEQGVLLAIRHIQRFSQLKKIIIIVPLIELGAESTAVHERIGRALAESTAEVYVLGLAHQTALEKAFNKNVNIHFFDEPRVLAHTLAPVVDNNSVILLEGRLPDIVRQTLV